MAYRAQLVPQFLWASLQAIEKYFKCILLLNRIKAKSIRHDLSAALDLLKTELPFRLRIREPALRFIKHVDSYGRFRYLEIPFHVRGPELIQLDMTIWDVRRYCQLINYIHYDFGNAVPMLDVMTRTLELSEKRPPQRFGIIGGNLEKIISDRKHPARASLLWKNLFYGRRTRSRVEISQYLHSTNSPLSLHPDLLDDVLKYVYLPKEVIVAYRVECKTRNK